MIEEEKKHQLLKILCMILATFVGAFLAFYLVVDLTFNRMISPEYHIKKMEKMMMRNAKNLERFESKIFENPFEPKMAPMLVNLVKETNEYKVIIDLKPLEGNEKNIDIRLNDNVLTVSGEMGKIERRGEKIMNFTQSFALDEELDSQNMTKEKRGNKYIVTIPFKD